MNKNEQYKVAKHRENSDDQQDVLTCEICAVGFKEDDDKLMSCDRCMKWNCAECLGMSEAIYSFFVASGSHWYCKYRGIVKGRPCVQSKWIEQLRKNAASTWRE